MAFALVAAIFVVVNSVVVMEKCAGQLLLVQFRTFSVVRSLYVPLQFVVVIAGAAGSLQLLVHRTEGRSSSSELALLFGPSVCLQQSLPRAFRSLPVFPQNGENNYLALRQYLLRFVSYRLPLNV